MKQENYNLDEDRKSTRKRRKIKNRLRKSKECEEGKEMHTTSTNSYRATRPVHQSEMRAYTFH